jgi:hypothetical protein
MPDYSGTALMGYARRVLERDRWTCRYCGLDGRIWPNWLYLTWDHLLPRDNPRRDEDERGKQEFIVAACFFCNVAHNRTRFTDELTPEQLAAVTPEQLVEQKRPRVLAKRAEYRDFWLANVASDAPPPFDVISSQP